MNPLGIPGPGATFDELERRASAWATLTDIEAVALAKTEQRIANQMGTRWCLDGDVNRRPEPAIRRPSDILAMRSAATDMQYGAPSDAWLGRVLMSAVPHWLDASAARGIAGSQPAPAGIEMRLPYPSQSIWFGRACEVGPATEVMPDAVARELTSRQVDPTVSVDGYIALADDDGRSVDLGVWVMRLAWSDDYTTRGLMPCIPTQADAAGEMIRNLITVVVHGWWQTTGRGIRPGATRRQIRHMARKPDDLIPVRVLQAGRSVARDTETQVDSATTHASPVAHLRRGHWRRVKGDNERLQWIAPTVVNPWNDKGDRVTVWALPQRKDKGPASQFA